MGLQPNKLEDHVQTSSNSYVSAATVLTVLTSSGNFAQQNW